MAIKEHIISRLIYVPQFTVICLTQAQAELSGLLSALHYFGLVSNVTVQSLGISRGQCHYSFNTYALLEERRICAPDDEHILHLTQPPPIRKPPILVKCLQPETPENATGKEPGLLMMGSSKEIISLLKPVGNATKRHEPGSCVVVHFCTVSSLECARVAPIMNLLPHLFPTLPIAYIDAYEFSRFNAEFGIVSLPTLMIFHQGRPLIKYDPSWAYSEKRSFGRFIMRHTNVKTVDPQSIPPHPQPHSKRAPPQRARGPHGLLPGPGLGLHSGLPRQLPAPDGLLEAARGNGPTQLAGVGGDPNGDGGLNPVQAKSVLSLDFRRSRT